MSESLATAMMVAGGAITLGSAVIGNVVFLRRVTAARGEAARGREVATLSLVQPLLVFAAIGAGGLGLLVIGAITGYEAPVWMLIFPLLMLAVSLGARWLVQRQLRIGAL